MRGKRAAAWIVTGVAVMSLLAGCASGEGENSGDSGADGKTVIKIWSKDRHDAAFIQDRIDAYNKNNTDNVQVNYELYTDNFQQAVDLAV